jgi:GNAT superfamily N-acetyltransferase
VIYRLVCRAAAESDLVGVVRLHQRWEAEGVTRGLVALDENFFRRFLGGCFFVAMRDERLVGYVCASPSDDERSSAVVPAGERYLEIESLYVLPEERSRGVGRLLLTRAEQSARSIGIRFVTAYSATHTMERILRYYCSNGYEVWAVQVFRALDG